MSIVCALLLGAVVAGPSLQGALAQEASGDDAAAVRTLTELSRRDPAWPLPHLELARILLKTGQQLDLAEVHLELAHAQVPESAQASYLYGLLLIERGRPRQAAPWLEQAVEVRPEDTEARYKLGSLLLRLNRSAEAAEQFEVLKRVKPGWTAARLQLARALEREQRLSECEQELEELWQSDPGSPAVRRQLASFYERTGRPQLARQVEGTPSGPRMRALRPSRH